MSDQKAVEFVVQQIVSVVYHSKLTKNCYKQHFCLSDYNRICAVSTID